jgi:hypothetical protein
MLEDTRIGNNFLNRMTRARIDKWDCIKLKSCCTSKKTMARIKRQSKEWEKNLCQLFFR